MPNIYSKSKRIVVCLDEKDYLELKKLAIKERLGISGLVRHFIIRKLYSDLETSKSFGKEK